MPEASKNVAIGSLVAIALGLVLWVLLFLHPSFGDGALKLHVRFADIEKINVGTRVTYAGRPVGEVTAISFIPDKERSSPQFPEVYYTYDLTLAIDSHIPIYNSDEITIGTSGLMGERFVAIIPHRVTTQKPTLLATNQVVYSQKPPTMEDAFSDIRSLTAEVASLVKENREDLDATIDSIRSASKELDKLLTCANQCTLVPTLAKAANQFDQTLQAANHAINRLNQADLVAKLDEMMSDINNYGVLYHLDKSWQRERKRRLELAEAVKPASPAKSATEQIANE